MEWQTWINFVQLEVATRNDAVPSIPGSADRYSLSSCRS